MIRIFFMLMLAALLWSCSKTDEQKTSRDQTLISYNVLSTFPHDPTAFTQGLTIYEGRLYESTGRADSWIAEVDIASGRQDKKVILDKKYFGEGITILNNKVYQLTWQDHVGFVYDARTFERLREFSNPREGWGITHNDRNLIVSDGTNKLFFLDTLSLQFVDTVAVSDASGPIDNLNELEFVDGYLYANRWGSGMVYKIDPASGRVAGRLDLTALTDKIRQVNPEADVLNGIAYEPKSNTWLVTGKLWPALFVLRLPPVDTLKKSP